MSMNANEIKTTFNHGYLCQMLRSASYKELTNIINDVAKEKERRNSEKEEYLKNIREAITKATDAGYVVTFYPSSFSDNAEYSIDEHSEISLDIQLE